MFIFKHYDYMQYTHEFIESGHTAKMAAQRNVTRYKTNAESIVLPSQKDTTFNEKTEAI